MFPDRFRRACRVRQRPADDGDALHALRLHVLRGQCAHLAGADDEDVPALEVAENLAREGDGGEAHRHGAGREARFRPDAFADGE